MKRRQFLRNAGTILAAGPVLGNTFNTPETEMGKIVTVRGEIPAGRLGFTLSHEHLLVDFTGAGSYDPSAWDRNKVTVSVLPYIQEIRALGCTALVDCTPEYIGRDPILLRDISDRTGIHILTNTGYYGASGNKYLPSFVFDEPAAALANRWIGEFEDGIGRTGIRPGFIKTGVDPGALSEIHRKLITAAGMTHLKTGLTIASHTGPAIPAFEEIALLRSMNIRPDAFIWVHAQNEKDSEKRFNAARMGAWVSLDGVNDENTETYAGWLDGFRKENLLLRVLVSHDAGWYTPGEPGGGDFRPFTSIYKLLIPRLLEKSFQNRDIDQIFVKNPAKVFVPGIKTG